MKRTITVAIEFSPLFKGFDSALIMEDLLRDDPDLTYRLIHDSANPPAWKPLRDQVIARPDPENNTSGGLYIPQGATKKPSFGTVVAVGFGECVGRIGDKVMYEGSGIDIGDGLVLLRENFDVLAYPDRPKEKVDPRDLRVKDCK